jgi:hypothetical protein
MTTIETMLREVALATEGVAAYGRGIKAYTNLDDKGKFPRLWIHAVNPTDNVFKNGLLTTQYEVVAELSSLCDYTADIANDDRASETYLSTLELLQGVYHKFITNLNKDSRNKTEIGRVNRREILHEYDDNVCGFVFTFTVQLRESIVYQCPT